jgi:membrane fusion protein, adhesin transport system
MLHISDNHVHIDTSAYQSFEKVRLSKAHTIFRGFLLIFFAFFLIVLFLPWTQSVRAKGVITTLTPDQRPQTIQATIAGRIEKWSVREGQLVKKGDTIVRLSEIKTEYFDPDLLERTQAQVQAKTGSMGSYDNKTKALDEQILQFNQELKFKKEQLANKIQQTRLKAEAEKLDIESVRIALENEQKQFKRTEELFKQGLKSLTDLENKKAKWQELQAKMLSSENKYQQSLQEMDNLAFVLRGAESEYAGKVAKTESDKQSTMSDKFGAEADVNKLKNQYSNYAARAQFYIITAPVDCYITKTTKAGIGETVKEGEGIANIVPVTMNLAVETYIEPIDLPLVQVGAPMRFVFDGWPAFVFSGWPNAAVGTYSGRVFAIDNVANDKGKYRILVQPDPEQASWPTALRPGSGANGFALLKNVPVWYELWRQLNGFPPEFYEDLKEVEQKVDKKKS